MSVLSPVIFGCEAVCHTT